MKDLLDYNLWANKTVLKILLENEVPEKTLLLYSHILNAEKIWLGRMANQAFKNTPVWKVYPKSELVNETLKSYDNWDNFISSLSEKGFLEVFNYQNTSGKSFQNSIKDVYIHVINHGTYHRSQIAMLLSDVDIKPPVTDYIFYKR